MLAERTFQVVTDPGDGKQLIDVADEPSILEIVCGAGFSGSGAFQASGTPTSAILHDALKEVGGQVGCFGADNAVAGLADQLLTTHRSCREVCRVVRFNHLAITIENLVDVGRRYAHTTVGEHRVAACQFHRG